MKISLSKPRRGEKRHVVILADTTETMTVNRVLREDVLPIGVRPITESCRIKGLPKVKFRLAKKYIEPVLLAFPFAETSSGLEERLGRIARDEVRNWPIPDLSRYDHLLAEGKQLLDYQKVAAARLMKRKRYLELDGLGLGKTFMSLAAAVFLQHDLAEAGEDIDPILCVVPNSIKWDAWANCLENFFSEITYSIVDGTAAQRREQINADVDVVVINHEGLRTKSELGNYKRNEDGSLWTDRLGKRRRDRIVTPVHPDLFERDWGVIIVDEYHKFKNPKAQMTTGMHLLKAKHMWAMTGTPVVNGRPEEYWSALHWLWPKRYPSYDQFFAHHCVVQNGKVVAYRNLHEIKGFVDARTESGLPSRSIRRRKEWILEGLPEPLYSSYELDMTKEQRRIYKRIRDELRMEMADGTIRNVQAALAKTTRLKQACFSPELFGGSKHSAKIDELKNIMEELTRNNEKAIVFSEWSKATRILEREFEHYNPAYVDGSVRPRDRAEQAKAFNEDEDCRLFIGTIGACSTGFSLGVATYVIFTDLDWVPANNIQAVGRSAAGGLRGLNARSSIVNVIELKMKDSIEQRIDGVLAQKQAMNARMTDKDTGGSFKTITLADFRDLL